MNLSESGYPGFKDLQDVIFLLMLGFFGFRDLLESVWQRINQFV